jgi:hypothetical protein
MPVAVPSCRRPSTRPLGRHAPGEPRRVDDDALVEAIADQVDAVVRPRAEAQLAPFDGDHLAT